MLVDKSCWKPISVCAVLGWLAVVLMGCGNSHGLGTSPAMEAGTALGSQADATLDSPALAADGAVDGSPPSLCRNGHVDRNESCDDGNTNSGDGCSDVCQVEPGWSCAVPGKRCVPICGDLIVLGRETCDDGNHFDGDGCSARCFVEPGWDCTNGTCVQVGFLDCGLDSDDYGTCGDGIVSDFEDCDNGPDNSDTAYGGCTTTCQYGPYCGDGVVSDSEECDLGERNGMRLNGTMSLTNDPTGLIYCTADCRVTHPIVR